MRVAYYNIRDATRASQPARDGRFRRVERVGAEGPGAKGPMPVSSAWIRSGRSLLSPREGTLVTMASRTTSAWLAQWREAGAALAEQRARELAAMTEEEALAAADAVLGLAALAPLAPERRLTSGLIDQQELLHRRRTR